MKDGNRSVTHTSKVSSETKMELLRLNRECNISSGDILTNYVKNKSNVNSHEILLKINMLEERLSMIERLEKEQNKLLNYIHDEHKFVLGEIKRLDNLMPVAGFVGGEMELNIKSSVKAFFDIRNQHTNVFGAIDVCFDALKVGRTLCGRYNVNHDVFSKSVELIDDGVDLDEFLSSDISKWGLV